MTQFDRKAHCQQIASSGGQATVQKHGKQHMSKIGRKGHETVINRYFQGDEQLFNNWLRRISAYTYWQSTGLPMKRDRQGRGIWPEEKPLHPAQANQVAPGQHSLFESIHKGGDSAS